MKFSKHILCGIGLFLTITSQALLWRKPTPLTQLNESQFRSLNLELLSRAEEKGLERIGPRKISDLREHLSQTQWKILPIFPSASGGERMGARNLLEENVVVLSRFALDRVSAAGLEELLLHEALGASGIDDEDYRVSLSLQTYVRCIDCHKNSALMQKILQVLGRATTFRRNRLYLLAGRGGTSVGGGGDGISSTIKTDLLMNWQPRSARDVEGLERLFKMKIVVDYQPRISEARLAADTLQVSYLAWMSFDDYRSQIVKRLSKELFL